MKGASSTSSSVAPIRSKLRLTAKSILEHRRLELEERQRLAGDELHAVHEDLHGRRRHPHANAMPVTAVHEFLYGLVLRNSGSVISTADGVEVALEQPERAEVLEAVGGERVTRHVAERIDLRAFVAKRVRHGLDVRSEPTSTARRR